jgi:hypothetical protein
MKGHSQEHIMAATLLALLFCGSSLPEETSGAPASVDAAKKAFLDVYEPAAKKLDDFCRRLRVRARIVAKYPQGERCNTVQYMANGRMLRLEIIDPIQNGKALETWAVVSHPKQSFRLVKTPSSKGYVIDWLVPEYHDFAKAVILEGEVAFAPFTWRDRPIASFLKQSNVSVEKVENLSVDGELLLKVAWKQAFQDSPGGQGALDHLADRNAWGLPARHGENEKPASGWFLFDRSHGWVLRGHGFAPYRTSLEYDKAGEGIPLLKKVESWREGKDGSRLNVTTAEIQEIVQGEVPEKEFMVTAFYPLGRRDVGALEAYEQSEKKRLAEDEARSRQAPVNLTDTEVTDAWLAAHPALDRWGRRFLLYVLIPVLLVIGLMRFRASRRRLGDRLSSRWTEPGTNWRRRKKRPPID